MRNCLRFQHIFSAAVAVFVAATFSGQGLAGMLDLSSAPGFMSSAEVPALGDTAALFDGDRSTRVATGLTDDEWIYVDLGQSYFLEAIRIDWEAAFGQDYDILVSDTDPGGAAADPTDSIWTTVAVIREYDQDGDAPPSHGADIDNILDFATGNVDLVSDLGRGFGAAQTSPDGRYVMLHGTQRGSQWGFSIWEMEIDGTPVPEPSSLILMLGGFVALVGYTVRYVKRTS